MSVLFPITSSEYLESEFRSDDGKKLMRRAIGENNEKLIAWLLESRLSRMLPTESELEPEFGCQPLNA